MAACDIDGNGEGELYLGTDQVTTDTNGDVSFTINLTTAIPYGYYVTATATDPNGNTSEFSACVAADVTPPTPEVATYVYDGDGVMVQSVVNGVTTYYAGAYQLEINVTDTIERKYYSAAGMRIAMRTQVNQGEEVLNWLLGDHLGSTSMTTDADGVVVSTVRYSAFGEIREQTGTTPTDYMYTGQRQEAEIGLYYYVARWYDRLICWVIVPPIPATVLVQPAQIQPVGVP